MPLCDKIPASDNPPMVRLIVQKDSTVPNPAIKQQELKTVALPEESAGFKKVVTPGVIAQISLPSSWVQSHDRAGGMGYAISLKDPRQANTSISFSSAGMPGGSKGLALQAFVSKGAPGVVYSSDWQKENKPTRTDAELKRAERTVGSLAENLGGVYSVNDFTSPKNSKFTFDKVQIESVNGKSIVVVEGRIKLSSAPDSYVSTAFIPQKAGAGVIVHSVCFQSGSLEDSKANKNIFDLALNSIQWRAAQK